MTRNRFTCIVCDLAGRTAYAAEESPNMMAHAHTTTRTLLTNVTALNASDFSSPRSNF